MDSTGNASLLRIGTWSSVGVVAFSLSFSVPGLLGFAGVLRFPWDPVLPDAGSLLLAMAFLVMMSALHSSAPAHSRHLTLIGLSFAGLYAALVSMVYFVALTVVVPLTQLGRVHEVELLAFDDQGSFMQALDGLGYFFMSVATFVASFAFERRGPDRWLRLAFVVNGALGLPILLSYMPLVVSWSAVLLPVNVLWIVSVPACGVLAARYFKRRRAEDPANPHPLRTPVDFSSLGHSGRGQRDRRTR